MAAAAWPSRRPHAQTKTEWPIPRAQNNIQPRFRTFSFQIKHAMAARQVPPTAVVKPTERGARERRKGGFDRRIPTRRQNQREKLCVASPRISLGKHHGERERALTILRRVKGELKSCNRWTLLTGLVGHFPPWGGVRLLDSFGPRVSAVDRIHFLCLLSCSVVSLIPPVKPINTHRQVSVHSNNRPPMTGLSRSCLRTIHSYTAVCPLRSRDYRLGPVVHTKNKNKYSSVGDI